MSALQYVWALPAVGRPSTCVLLVSLRAQTTNTEGLGAACGARQERAGSMGRGRAWHAGSGRWRPRWQSDRLDLAYGHAAAP